MFEAIHGSAPRRAGQNLANPSGLLLGAVLMLVHIGQPEVAERVHNAWLRTIEDGIHTYDIFDEGVSKQKVGTKEFAEAVIARLGQKPQTLKPVRYERGVEARSPRSLEAHAPARKELVGVDVFLDWTARTPDELAAVVKHAGRRRAQPGGDHQPRHEGLAGRHARNVLHRPLALPLPVGSGRDARAGHRPAGARERRRPRLHQDREPLHVRRQTRLLRCAGAVVQARFTPREFERNGSVTR